MAAISVAGAFLLPQKRVLPAWTASSLFCFRFAVQPNPEVSKQHSELKTDKNR
jgi:hypothetical protein